MTPPIAQLSVPADVRNVDWLASRRDEQATALATSDVYHDFQFTDELGKSGIHFVHRTVDDAGRHYKAVHYDHGQGLAAADVDGDGLMDIFFVNQVGANALVRNLGGGRFEDITERAGVGVPDAVKVGASFVDYDNDGDADLFVTTVRSGNRLFQNRGDGTFSDVTGDVGLDYAGHSSAGVFFDYDRDGFLDLFLCNVGKYTSDNVVPVTNYERLPDAAAAANHQYYEGFTDAFAGHLKPERSEASILYKNVDGQRFRDVSESVGLVDNGWTGDATPIDVNADGWLDLYVLNMQGQDHYYENIGGERFEEKTDALFPKSPWGSMGVKVLDFNNDGLLDLYVTDMHSDMSQVAKPDQEKSKSDMLWPEVFLRSQDKCIFGNAFYKRGNDGTFTEVSDAIGAENFWPWGLSAGDLNADGFEDVFIASSMNYPYRYGVNSVLLNDGGLRFLDSEFAVGVEPRAGGATAKPWFILDCSGEDKENRQCEGATGLVEVWAALGSRSSAVFDLEGDGDLDVVTSEFNAAPMILTSNLAAKRPIHWINVSLTGTTSNRDGIGAVVTVESGANSYSKSHDGKSGYLSQSRMPLYFGLGEAAGADRIRVRWPSGNTQTVSGPIESGTTVAIVESAG